MSRPIWRWPYHWPRQNLSEMLKEIIAGTFRSNQEGAMPRSLDMQREVLLQCKEAGLIEYNGKDCNIHMVSISEIRIIPQPEPEKKWQNKNSVPSH